MVSHYSSSDFAQLHGKTIYVQYSKRQEFVVNKFTEGNILIVSMEGIQAGDISIDAIHLVSLWLSSLYLDLCTWVYTPFDRMYAV